MADTSGAPPAQQWLPENPAAGDGVHEGPRGYVHALKDGDTFAVLGAWGDMNPHRSGEQGLYHDGTRFLSRLSLRVEGKWPVLLHATTSADNVWHSSELISPALDRPTPLDRGAVHLRRTACVIAGGYRERLVLTSFAAEPITLTIGYQLAADFRDMFEIRGLHRLHRGELKSPVLEGDRLLFDYRGRDGVDRQTVASWRPSPVHMSPAGAEIEVALDPRRPRSIELHLDCGSPAPRATVGGFAEATEVRSRARAADLSRACQVHTSNQLYNQWIARSHADLSMMTTHLPSGPYPFAGLPWFSTVFGRDGLLSAWATLWADQQLTRGVLRTLAEQQATETDAASDAEPGKIVHELRTGEMAACGEIPFGRYYGSVDATSLFVMLAGAHLRVTGDPTLAAELWSSIEAALGWLDGFSGLVTYRPSPRGLIHQGWKDSPTSVFHADGTPASGDIALCEAQAYAYAARLAAADIAEALGKPGVAEQQRARAAALRARFEAQFWMEDRGCYALAIDGDGKPCQVTSSNAGHALACGIASPERAERVAETLMAPPMFSGWGIRTLSSECRRYNPASYHNGSVWPHDNAVIAEGFRRHGMTQRAARLLESFAAAACELEISRLPELLCGFDRRPELSPTPYPSACAPQAWASTAVFQLLAASLGLDIDGQHRRVVFRHPALPADLDEVELRGLAVGDARVDVSIHRHRHGDRIAVATERCEGPHAEVVVTP